MLRLGAIADDYTGGSDLAGMLAERGARTAMFFGVPDSPLGSEFDAAVVCLKSRSIPAADARAMSARALAWLQAQGAQQIQFKYCSTFDSTARGNIGPVLDELLDRLGERLATAIPALPVNGRTQYCGHLFVNGVPLNESPMRDHPLNPMTDANLVRHLAAQTPSHVGLVPLGAPVAERCAELARDGVRMALVDAITNADLASIAEGIASHRLFSGGSGIGAAIADRWALPRTAAMPAPLNAPRGTVMIAGSCSAATLAQLQRYQGAKLHFRDAHSAPHVLRHEGRVLIYSSAPPDQRETAPGAAADLEHHLAACAVDLRARRIIVAGGETSGAVVDALGIRAVEILRVLSPGVPALRTLEPAPRALVLKSGNFGSPDFFTEAAAYLESL